MEAFPDGKSLMEAYTPDKISSIMAVSDRSRIFKGQSPELSLVSRLYGLQVTQAWLEVQLGYVNEYIGVKEKLSARVIHDLAHMLQGIGYYLRMSEMMLFFAYLMSGRYGRFYGAVDPVTITSALRQFIVDRDAEIEHINRMECIRQREEALRRRREGGQ